MEHRNIFILAALVAVFLMAYGFQDPSGYRVLFEKAKYTMETKGDLNGAIALFNDIIKKYPKEREYAAKSQLYIGLCYEKLGVKEAQKAYQKVVSSYPEQTETVRLANEKLSLLRRVEPTATKEDKEFSIKRVKELPGMGVPGTVSPDGKYLLYAEDGSLDLSVYETATGNKRTLVKGDIESDAYTSRWSPDGKLVAYTWYHDSGQMDLRAIGFDGTGSRILFSGDHEVSWLDPEDWSPDGNTILTTVYGKDKTSHLLLISVHDGSVRMLKDFGSLSPGPSRFSPDGRYVAYTVQQSSGANEKDIFVLDLDNGRETTLVQDPADDIFLDWTPDGRGILFRSDRTGSAGIWWTRVSEGKSVGNPELIKPDLGPDFKSMGFARNGSYFYCTQKEMKDVYIAELDLVTGKLISAPGLATQRFAGSNYFPDWSADGKQLLFLSQRVPGVWAARTLCVRSTNSGEIHELVSRLNIIGWVRLSPDGHSLLALAAKPKGGYGTFLTNIQTGDYQLLMTPHIGWPATWSRDGKSIYAIRSDSVTNGLPIVNKDLETGREKKLFDLSFSDSSHYVTGPVLSPDGRQLAFSVSESGSRIIKVIPAGGGEAHELLHGDQSVMSFGFGTIAWTPDGRNILFVRAVNSGGSETGLWMIPIAGGEPRKLELKADNMHDLSVHPDGKHIAFTASKTKSEVWVMENFLPKEKIGADNQLTLRKLDNPQLNTPFARLSPDGNKLAYLVYSGNFPKRIDILDMGTGKEKALVESGLVGYSSFVWSPQGDKIAYTTGGKELYIRNTDGSNSRLLLKDSSRVIYPTDWSGDGKKIACFFEEADRKVKIGTVTSNGQVKYLISGNSIDFGSEPKISPDGSYVAFSQGDNGGNNDVFTLSSDGSRKIRVTDHPGRDENPVWSPDGRYLVFLSDRNRSVDLWGVQVKDGKPAGAPFIIKNDIGWRTRIHDLTASGKLFLLMLGGAEPPNLFTIPVDQINGDLKGSVTPVSVYPTAHYFPRYSPDGKMIAYLSRKGQIGLPKLFVLNEKGAEQELPLQGYNIVNVAWHPGNRSLIFAGWDKDYNAGIFEVSLEREGIKPIYKGEKVDLKADKGGLGNLQLLPDIGKLMFIRGMGKGNMDVITCDTDGRNMAVVLPGLKTGYWSLPSPTGEYICYRTSDSLMIISVSDRKSRYIGSYAPYLEASWSPNGENLMFREGRRLRIFSLKENASRTLYEAPTGKMIGGMELYAPSWSPDGNRFIFTERDTSAISDSPQKLILINPADRTYKTVGEAPEGYRLSELRWSPDGSKVVATGRSINSVIAPMYEYWVLENFLPK